MEKIEAYFSLFSLEQQREVVVLEGWIRTPEIWVRFPAGLQNLLELLSFSHSFQAALPLWVVVRTEREGGES